MPTQQTALTLQLNREPIHMRTLLQETADTFSIAEVALESTDTLVEMAPTSVHTHEHLRTAFDQTIIPTVPNF